jgi:hypothetical protein
MRERKDIEAELGTNSYGQPNGIATALYCLLEVTLDNRDLLMENRKLYTEVLDEIKHMITGHDEEMKVIAQKLFDKTP